MKLKVLKNKKKYKLYNLKKKIKFNKILNLGKCLSYNKLYIFMYQQIISYFKLGSNNSKQFLLISIYFLKYFLNKNI